MTAAEARELFSAAYEGELDAPQAEAFAAALAASGELAREYEAFVATLGFARASAAEPPVRGPNLLPGVQHRLRARSRGRFYPDRFSERMGGGGLLQPLPLALLLLGLLVVAWLAQAALSGITVSPMP